MATDNSNNSNNSDWMNKFQEVINSCQVELKKTTQIGMKMLSASQSNAQLHETFETLGYLTREALRNGDIKWESEKVNELLAKIDNLENELENFEFEVRNLKNPSSSEQEKNP